MPDKKFLRLAIVEDDETARELLSSYFATQWMQVSNAGSIKEFKALLAGEEQPFDIVLLDLGLPDESGLNIIEALSQSTGTGVIVLSAQSEQQTKVEALRLGADDYVTKPFDLQELQARISALHRRLQGSTTSTLNHNLTRHLSQREVTVLTHIAKGATVKNIAATLGVSPRTIETYRKRLAEKLNVQSIAELTQVAVKAGLV